MTTIRELMTTDPQCVREGQTLVEAAELMRDYDVGALPVCTTEGALSGMITDRDIVVRCIAQRGDPARVTAGEIAQGDPVSVEVDADVEDVLRVMQDNQVRRVPVLEGGELVGIISQGDIALSVAPAETGETVARISEQPAS